VTAAAPDARPRSTRAAILVPFAIVTLIWGSTWIVIRDQIGTVPPSWSVCYRFALAAAAMALYARARGVALRLPPRGQGLAVAVGLCLFCANFNFVYRAERHVTSGLVAVVFALLVVPNALLARAIYGQRLSRPFLLGSAVAMGGIALLFAHELEASDAGPAAVLLGIALTLTGVCCASVGNVLQAGSLARTLPVEALLAWAMLWGALADGALAWATTGPPSWDTRPAYALGIGWLALAGSTLAFPLYFRIIRQVGPARAAYSSVLVPVIAMALSTLFEGYRWSVEAAGGAALVLAGLVVALIARSPAR